MAAEKTLNQSPMLAWLNPSTSIPELMIADASGPTQSVLISQNLLLSPGSGSQRSVSELKRAIKRRIGAGTVFFNTVSATGW